MFSIKIILFAQLSLAYSCPKPRELARQIANYWVDGLEYGWSSKKCFSKKRYKDIRAVAGKTVDTPVGPEKVVYLDSKKPFKIVGVKIKDPAFSSNLRYVATAEFKLHGTTKTIRDKFEFDLNDGSVKLFKDRKKWGCAFHSGLRRKYLRKKCFKNSEKL